MTKEWRGTARPRPSRAGTPGRTSLPALPTMPGRFRTEALLFEGGGVTVLASTTGVASRCPSCGQLSRRTHSRYARTVADLPWGGVPIRFRLSARRLFCDEPSCERRIFCERLANVASHARKTVRLEAALLAIALELGGEAGARLTEELGMPTSPDALLRRIRGVLSDHTGPVRVLGVDDFAFRRGHHYATILVDLERRRVVDLLPERSAGSLARWLRKHPGVEMVARDRSHIYREGVSEGAPQATQVADRWHLLHNLAWVLEESLLQKRPALKKAALPTGGAERDATEDVGAPGPTTPNRPRLWYARQEDAARKRHERLVERWKAIRRLYLAGADLRDICKRLGVSARTVYRYKDLEEPPPRPAHKRRASVLDPYVPYLVRRWNEGCRNGQRLYREIREQGYSHGKTNVERLFAEFRRAEKAGRPAPSVPLAGKEAVPTPRNVAALFLRREGKLTAEQVAYLERLCASDAAVADALRLTREFAGMVRERGGERLDRWLEEAAASEASAMRRFATSLGKDLSAVRAGLTEEWSNGPVEGFVHKLKLLKRQGYGRANFDLLRARMLAA